MTTKTTKSNKWLPAKASIGFYCLALLSVVSLSIWSVYNTSRAFNQFAEHIEKLELELDKLHSKEASATAAATNIEDFRVLKLAELRRETAKVAQVCAEFQYEGIATVLLLIGFSAFLLYHNKRFVSESEAHVETTRKLALLVETSFDGIFSVDGQLLIQSWSPACQRIFGFSREEVVGSTLSLLWPPALGHELQVYRKALAEGVAISPYESRALTKSGKEISVSISASPVLADYDRVDGMTIVVRDVSFETTMRQQKEDLIAALAHDLKNPLIGSNLLLEIIREDFATMGAESVRDMTSRLSATNNRMIETINEMLDVYRLESGAIEIVSKPTDLSGLCHELEKEFSFAFERKKIAFKSEIAADLSVLSDPNLLRRIIYNLLDNALKYCTEGNTVIFSASLTEGGSTEIAVDDDGPGLDDNERRRVFQRLFRRPVSATGSEGSGLGLYAARLMSDLIKARIECQSKSNAGTRFKIIL